MNREDDHIVVRGGFDLPIIPEPTIDERLAELAATLARLDALVKSLVATHNRVTVEDHTQRTSTRLAH